MVAGEEDARPFQLEAQMVGRVTRRVQRREGPAVAGEPTAVLQLHVGHEILVDILASRGAGSLDARPRGAAAEAVCAFQGVLHSPQPYRSALVMTDALAGHSDQLVEQLALRTAGSYRLFGGGAGDDGRFQSTHVFAGRAAHTDAVDEFRMSAPRARDDSNPVRFNTWLRSAKENVEPTLVTIEKGDARLESVGAAVVALGAAGYGIWTAVWGWGGAVGWWLVPYSLVLLVVALRMIPARLEPALRDRLARLMAFRRYLTHFSELPNAPAAGLPKKGFGTVRASSFCPLTLLRPMKRGSTWLMLTLAPAVK